MLKPSPSDRVGPVLLRALVQRGVHVHARLPRHARGEAIRRAAGQRLGLDASSARSGRVGGEVAAQRQLLQAHQLGALVGGAPDRGGERLAVLLGILVPALLHRRDPKQLRGARGGCAPATPGAPYEVIS